MSTQRNYSTAGIGHVLGVEPWRVARLYEDGTLPEPERFAGKRVVSGESIPQIVDALRARGWLPSAEPAEPALT